MMVRGKMCPAGCWGNALARLHHLPAPSEGRAAPHFTKPHAPRDPSPARSPKSSSCPPSPRAAQPLGASHLVSGPAAGEEVPIIVTVQGDVENVGVPVEDLLGPIAVVNILGGERSWGSALK